MENRQGIVSKEKVQRYFVFGDIHGDLLTLKAILKEIEVRFSPTMRDLFIFAGDLIDRGTDSIATIEFLMALRSKYRCIFLLGNHERFFMDDYTNSKALCDDYFSENLNAAGRGVEALLVSSKRDQYFEFINQFSLFFYAPDDHMFVSHAPIYRSVDPEIALRTGMWFLNSVEDAIKYLREYDYTEPFEYGFDENELIADPSVTMFCGHLELSSTSQHGNHFCLDLLGLQSAAMYDSSSKRTTLISVRRSQ